MDKTTVIKEHSISNWLVLLLRVIAIAYVVYQYRNRDKSQGLLFEEEGVNDLWEMIAIISFVLVIW